MADMVDEVGSHARAIVPFVSSSTQSAEQLAKTLHQQLANIPRAGSVLLISHTPNPVKATVRSIKFPAGYLSKTGSKREEPTYVVKVGEDSKTITHSAIIENNQVKPSLDHYRLFVERCAARTNGKWVIKEPYVRYLNSDSHKQSNLKSFFGASSTKTSQQAASAAPASSVATVTTMTSATSVTPVSAPLPAGTTPIPALSSSSTPSVPVAEVEKPRTPFVYFTLEQRPKIKAENPQLEFLEIVKLMDQRWSAMSVAEQQPYVKKHEEAKAQYDLFVASQAAHAPHSSFADLPVSSILTADGLQKSSKSDSSPSSGVPKAEASGHAVKEKVKKPKPVKVAVDDPSAMQTGVDEPADSAGGSSKAEKKPKQKRITDMLAPGDTNFFKVPELTEEEKAAIKAKRLLDASTRKAQKLKEKREAAQTDREKHKDVPTLLDESEVADLTPLPSWKSIDTQFSAQAFGDVILVCEFLQYFTPALATHDLNDLTPAKLEALIVERKDKVKLQHVLACFILTLMEVSEGDTSCKVLTAFGAQLCDLPVNEETCSELLRLLLTFTHFGNTSILKELEKADFVELSTDQILEVFAFLTNLHFAHHEVADVVNSSHERVAQIVRDQADFKAKRAKEGKEGAKSDKAGVEVKEKTTESTVDADAALAAQIAASDLQLEDDFVATRRTRNRANVVTLSVEEKAIMEEQQAAAQRLLEETQAEQHQRDIEAELEEKRNCVRVESLGCDRNDTSYWLFRSCPGLFACSSSAEWFVFPDKSSVEELIDALHPQTLRESALRTALTANKETILSQLEGQRTPSKAGKQLAESDGLVDFGTTVLASLKETLMRFLDKLAQAAIVEKAPFVQLVLESENPSQLAKVLVKVAENIQEDDLKAPLNPDSSSKTPRSVGSASPLEMWTRFATHVAQTSSQISLLLEVFEESIRWESTYATDKCRVCRKATDGQNMLLCDKCDHGFHIFCLKPRLTEIPAGDWYCNACQPATPRRTRSSAKTATYQEQESSSESSNEENAEDMDSEDDRRATQSRRRTTRSAPSARSEEVNDSDNDEEEEEDGSSDLEEASASRRGIHKKPAPKSSTKSKASRAVPVAVLEPKPSSNVFVSSVRGNKQSQDLKLCEDIWRAVSKIDASWLFLTPVSVAECPDYYDIIKQPMDLSMIRTKLDSMLYFDAEDFARDMRLMVQNCFTYNQESSEAYKCGRALSQSFEKRFKSAFGDGSKKRTDRT
eukprot:m.414445 g.414445  ORF g.414445 m.414445 type:complete len:1229 (+) comp56592_c0_seq9:156-3842(+)